MRGPQGRSYRANYPGSVAALTHLYKVRDIRNYYAYGGMQHPVTGSSSRHSQSGPSGRQWFTKPLGSGGGIALILASHPLTAAHWVNMRRLVTCIPAAKIVISVSNEFFDQTRRAFANSSILARIEIVPSINDRYDTGKWCVGLQSIGAALKSYRWIVLANDSIYLTASVNAVFQALASGLYDAAGLVSVPAARAITASGKWSDTLINGSSHLQSYFRAYTVQATSRWQEYSCRLPSSHYSFQSKGAIIIYHEVGSSRLFPHRRIFAMFDESSSYIRGWMGNISLWHNSIPLGFPVAKKQHTVDVCWSTKTQAAWEPFNARLSAEKALEDCLLSRFGGCTVPKRHIASTLADPYT